MMKSMRVFIAGMVAGTLLVGAGAYASSGITVDFTPITFLFDGVEKHLPAGQQGFIYQGTTYVPLRFVSESLGKTVAWDSKTRTASISSANRKNTAVGSLQNASEDAVYTNSADGYSIHVPSGMSFKKISTDDGSTAVLGTKTIGGAELAMKFCKLEGVGSDTDAESLGKYAAESMKKQDGYTVIKENTMVMDGYDAVEFVYTHETNGEKMYISEYYVLAGDYDYDLYFMTAKEPSDTFRQVIAASVSSFKVAQ